MGNFCIAFTGEFADDDPSVAIGEVKLGKYLESFQAILGFWEIEDYEKSWLTALRRLVGGASISCLVTSLTDPENSQYVVTWPLYRTDGEVFVQNQLIFLDQLGRKFEPQAPWDFIEPHATIDEDGQRISEWQLQLKDIQDFLMSRSTT
jgi:CdiI N-terminal domain